MGLCFIHKKKISLCFKIIKNYLKYVFIRSAPFHEPLNLSFRKQSIVLEQLNPILLFRQLLSLVKSYYLVWEQNNELRKKVERDQESVYKDTERYQVGLI